MDENGFARAFGGDGGTVRVNAGGDAPGHSPFLCFKNSFLANERDNVFGEGVKNYKKPHKTLTNKWRA